MREYYDKVNKRLVFIGKASGAAYWDEHWRLEDLERLVKLRDNRFIVKNTKKYLSASAKILEGGCGQGDKVYALSLHGYDAYGVDYAKETVEKINRYAPELKITLGDVRNLQFPDGFFDGYWSLGVLEHFYDGYDSISREMHRVLNKGGYLFLTVPVMSWLRRKKAKLGKYPEYKESREMRENFYQFAFEFQEIVTWFERNGFKRMELRPFSGIKGLKDEIPILRPLLQWIYDSNSFTVRIMKKIIDIAVRPFANHMIFFIFKKL